MFTSPPTSYPGASQPLSTSVPQLPATIIFNPGSVPGVPSYLPEQSGPFLSQSHLSGFLSHGLQTQEPFSHGDLNSPGMFRRNLNIALSEVEKLQMLARTVLSNIENAYQPRSAPNLSQAHIERLQDQFALTIQTLSQSGVGALPLLPVHGPSTSSIPAAPQIPSEEDMLSSTTKNLQILYDKVQKTQENAAVVGKLLGFEKEKETAGPVGGSTTGDSLRK